MADETLIGQDGKNLSRKIHREYLNHTKHRSQK